MVTGVSRSGPLTSLSLARLSKSPLIIFFVLGWLYHLKGLFTPVWR